MVTLNHDCFDDRLRPVTRSSLKKYLIELFKDSSLEDLIGMITNEQLESIEYIRLSHGKDACRKTSLLFNPHRLDTKVSGAGKYTCFTALQLERLCDNLSRLLLYKSDSRGALYSSFQWGFGGVPFAAEFSPPLARDLFLRYSQCNRGAKVLDPCAGWGGRMLGISVVGGAYVGYEPSTKTFTGLQKLGDFISRMIGKFDFRIECIPFEDSCEEDNSFDFALTSPPYYNTEQYSDESSNSLNRYGSFDDWVGGFYVPLITKTMNALKPDGRFILNVGDRKYPLSTVLFDHFSTMYKISEIPSKLCNHGAGKNPRDGEKFYLIEKK